MSQHNPWYLMLQTSWAICSGMSNIQAYNMSTALALVPVASQFDSCLRASPCPWKNRKDKAKSAMKMSTSEMTTAEVVDSPTPLAPPPVVKPHEQLTCT